MVRTVEPMSVAVALRLRSSGCGASYGAPSRIATGRPSRRSRARRIDPCQLARAHPPPRSDLGATVTATVAQPEPFVGARAREDRDHRSILRGPDLGEPNQNPPWRFRK